MLKLGLNFRISSFAANLKLNFMYSSEDLERFYFQYQTEGVPKGISIQTFCLTNQVPYNLFPMVQGYAQENSRSAGGWLSY